MGAAEIDPATFPFGVRSGPILTAPERVMRERVGATSSGSFALRATLGEVAELLIVDDDPAIRRMLERTLAAEGYRVRAVADGGTALAAAERSLARSVSCSYVRR